MLGTHFRAGGRLMSKEPKIYDITKHQPDMVGGRLMSVLIIGGRLMSVLIIHEWFCHPNMQPIIKKPKQM